MLVGLCTSLLNGAFLTHAEFSKSHVDYFYLSYHGKEMESFKNTELDEALFNPPSSEVASKRVKKSLLLLFEPSTSAIQQSPRRQKWSSKTVAGAVQKRMVKIVAEAMPFKKAFPRTDQRQPWGQRGERFERLLVRQLRLLWQICFRTSTCTNIIIYLRKILREREN